MAHDEVIAYVFWNLVAEGDAHVGVVGSGIGVVGFSEEGESETAAFRWGLIDC